MTKDVQHDHNDSPLASVSDEINTTSLSREPEGSAEGAEPATSQADASDSSGTCSFEGFGTFSG